VKIDRERKGEREKEREKRREREKERERRRGLDTSKAHSADKTRSE
jgi:hypothetical protein